MRLGKTPCAALLLFGAAVTWAACSSKSNESGASSDAGASDATEDLASGDDVSNFCTCDPCYSQCQCTPGDQWPAPQACKTYVCGGSGVWGPFNCLGGGCPDASPAEDAPSSSDGAEPIPDATTDAPGDATHDAPSDVSSDVAVDASNE